MRSLIISVLFLLLQQPLCAQYKEDFLGTKNKKAQAFFDLGYKSARIGDFKAAVANFAKAVEKDPEYVDAYLLLARCYEEMTELSEEEKVARAEKYYKKALEINPSYTKTHYFMASMYFRHGKFIEAADNYKKFLNKDTTTVQKEYLRTAMKNFEVSEMAIPYLTNPFNHNPRNMGEAINTAAKREYFPTLTADGKYFVYTRLMQVTPGAINEDIYISEKGPDGKYQLSESISALINSRMQEGAVSISPDGQIIFFAAVNPAKGFGRFDLYMSRKDGNEWLSPENLGAPVNTAGWESQPCFSPDGKTLYFASNRPGGYGKEDIWMSTMVDGKFTEPVNLGPTINTAESDQCPFIYFDNQTLYFSSRGHAGFGGDDLFISRKDENGNWQKPVNLGIPINTAKEELSMTISRDGTKAFYASTSSTPGDLDIFEFDLPQWARPKQIIYVKGYIYDAETKARLGANIELIDLQTGKTAATVQSNPGTGEYLVCLLADHDYAFNVNGKSYLFHSENFSLKQHPTTEPFELNVGLHKLKVGESVVLNNVFFDVDKAILKPQSTAELDKLVALMNEYPKMKIEIGGHTDNSGNPTHNQTLSQNRAKAVYDYLVNKGVAANRLSFKGYGESKPKVPNDSDANKALNRRTEFKITAI